MADFALQQAQAHGCGDDAAVNYVEAGFASSFEKLPDDTFFNDCTKASTN